jgi:hypothetical protein
MTKLIFAPADHRYYVGAVEIPSLSRVLEYGGIAKSLDKIPRYILERKRQIGTAVHLAIKLHLEDDLDWSTLDPQVTPYVFAALSYLQREDRKILEVETPVGGLRLGYACTPDLIVEGGIVEWKTTYAIYPEVEVQLAGQARAVGGKQARRVVQLKKDGTFAVKDYGTDADGLFKAALAVAQWRLKHEPKRRSPR